MTVMLVRRKNDKLTDHALERATQCQVLEGHTSGGTLSFQGNSRMGTMLNIPRNDTQTSRRIFVDAHTCTWKQLFIDTLVVYTFG